MRREGILIIIAAASGTGKTSLVAELIKQNSELVVSISHTTRPKRPNEIHGVNYFFLEDAEFETMIKAQAFLEYANVFGNYYGTAKEWVRHQQQQGKDVILEIDWQGAQQIRQQYPDNVSIFILPPSFEILLSRLQQRNQDEAHVIQNRMQAAKNEISHYQEFDYLIVNDDFQKALLELQTIIEAEHLKTSRQQGILKPLFDNLLA